MGPGTGGGLSGAGEGIATVVTLGFIAVAVLVLVSAVGGAMKWQRNNASPVVSKPATVVAKRPHTSGGRGDRATTTTYYVTFEAADGSRLELRVPSPEYGMLAEGDRGTLTSQGTRYQGFQRGS